MIFASSGVPPNTRMEALAIRITPAVCEEEGPIMIGPIISNTLLLFAINDSAPKMMLSKKLTQFYGFCLNKLLVVLEIKRFDPSYFQILVKQFYELNGCEQLSVRM